MVTKPKMQILKESWSTKDCLPTRLKPKDIPIRPSTTRPFMEECLPTLGSIFYIISISVILLVVIYIIRIIL